MIGLPRNQSLNFRCAATVFGFVVATVTFLNVAKAQTREEKVREDRARVEGEGFWIYNDWNAAVAQARETNKPMVVVLRCIPCEECVKLDDHLVDEDPVLRPLLEQFVRVRLVSTNGLDLELFQYDFDQSFAVFLLHSDGTIYGRFGTRSHRTEWVGDVSLEGLARALQGALYLHKNYDSMRESLVGKRGQPLEFASPEKYPSLSGKYSSQLATSGEIVKSCIHCHQIGDARRDFYRQKGAPIPESLIYPYPHPKTIGLTLDPRATALVSEVAEMSSASAAGLRAGDLITHLNGQPILSIADVQWVLEHTDAAGGDIVCRVKRETSAMSLTLKLANGWRRADDISWRASTWGFRRMTTGGLTMQPLDDDERELAKISGDGMALRIKHVGQYGPHAAAKQAGFRADDVVVSFGDRSDLRSESELIAHGLATYRPGDVVPVTIMRQGKRIQLQLPMQP